LCVVANNASGFAAVKDDDGRVIANFTIKNDRLGIGEFVDKLKAFMDVRFAVEYSGKFRVELYEFLEERGFRVGNRVHTLLDRQKISVGFTGLYGARGRSWLRGFGSGCPSGCSS
jgi:hypothetical protein